jgi:polysaccharide export outer membrane protein
MAVIGLTRPRVTSFCSLIAAISILSLGTGCSNVYRVSNLPRKYHAPAQQSLETANLGGLANSSVSSKVIQPGDVLEVTMVTDFSKLTTSTTPIRVAQDGSIMAPLIGKVNLAGYEVEQAEQILASESISRGVFRNPNITVTMKQNRTNRITVVGAVNKPGTLELPRNSCSLLGAIVAAEGLSKEAGPEVEIRRTDVRGLAQNGVPSGVVQTAYAQDMPPLISEPTVEKINLTEATKQGAARSPALNDGDVVYVPKKVLKPIYVLGLVRQSGEYPYPPSQELRVLDAIALAKGFSNPLVEQVLIIREVPGEREPIRIAINVQEAKQGQENIALAPGDTVSAEHTPVTAVTDVISTFFRVGIGTTVSMF